MKTIGNIIWFLLIGLWEGLGFYIVGIILHITIIGIPLGKQCFKLGRLSFLPFGKEVNTKFDSHPIANVIWLIFVGISMALGYIMAGIIFCITIIGIPFGKQCFKLTHLALIPFGAEIKD